MREYDVIVIGAGPAGLMAAGRAAENGHKTAILEKMEKPARKLRITGKGRCNITNIKPENEVLAKVRTNAPFFKISLEAFSNQDTVNFFRENGLELEVERGGRVFPASGDAWDVADTLEHWVRGKNVPIFVNSRVTGIFHNENLGFKITVTQKNENWTYYAKKIVIATGGITYPATGSTGDGYNWAHDLGHKIEPLRPSLVPLEIESEYMNDLAGLELKNINFELIINGEPTDERFGDMSFTRFGVTGPVILQLSRDIVDALIEEYDVVASIDLKPALTEAVLVERITREMEGITRGGTAKVLLQKLIPRELIYAVGRTAGLEPSLFVDKIEPQQIKNLIKTLKDFRIKISDYRPIEEAIVTAGGVDVSEVDPFTMESKIVKGIYFAGEILDIDADTGGYNLQIAFSTGYVAGALK